MPSFFAFLHHVAAFALVAALVLEFVLVKDDLSVKTARKLLLADLVLGASAFVVLIVGFLRVLYFEKGASYYFHSVPFIAKLSLFVIVALLSIYPTVEFLSWRKPLKEGRVPIVSDRKVRLIRSIIHWELVGIVLLILGAALMARGVGHVG
jgi:putative membrane protein